MYREDGCCAHPLLCRDKYLQVYTIYMNANPPIMSRRETYAIYRDRDTPQSVSLQLNLTT